MNLAGLNGKIGINGTNLYRSSNVMTDTLSSNKYEQAQSGKLSFGNRAEFSKEASKGIESTAKALLTGTAAAGAAKLTKKSDDNQQTQVLTKEHKKIIRKYKLGGLVSELEQKVKNGTLSLDDAISAFGIMAQKSGVKKIRDFLYKDSDYIELTNETGSSEEIDEVSRNFAQITKIPVISELFRFVKTVINLDLSNLNPQSLKNLKKTYDDREYTKFPDGAVLSSLEEIYGGDLTNVDPKSLKNVRKVEFETKFRNGTSLPSLEGVYHCDLSNVDPQNLLNVKNVFESKLPNNAVLPSLESADFCDLSNVDFQSLPNFLKAQYSKFSEDSDLSS